VDIASWLRELGLHQYVQTFRSNDIDVKLLRQLTAEDLKEIGVASVGHRRRLLDAIASLPDVGAEPTPPLLATPPDHVTAERRQLTVMFVDLVGSTALSERLDPEDLRVVIRAYQDACAGTIARFDGFVAKYLGDGILAYFGWPRTHEDEAVQAVRAGLAIVEAVADLAVPGGPLTARIGLATGLVVVGDLLGEGAAREEAVFGETPNLAARVQQLAAPGSVTMADVTRRLLGGQFELEDLGAHPLRGFGDPARIWRAVGEHGVADRFEARRAVGGLTRLVGREHEIALLLDRWSAAAGGQGQVVLVSGEPGIGKSRIVEALHKALGDAPHALLRYQCSPQYTGSVLHPVVGRLEHAAGFRRGDDAATRLAKLEDLLAHEVENAAAVLPLFADLLAIPTGGHHPVPRLTPQQQKAKTLAALAGQLEALAARRPVLLVFEDLHWADPTSLEWLGIVVERIERLPVLALLTFRSEFSPPWGDHAHALHLDLGRLGRQDATALALGVGGGKTLPPAILERVVAQTDGVPLFVEELTRAVLETGLLDEAGDQFVLRGPLAIPATLHDSLMARLDRLGPATKEVAQLAACIGREFPHDMLAAVSACRSEDLAASLDRLAGSNLVVRHGGPTASYAFRHTLVQEAAYQSLLKSRRQQLHERIAQIVTVQFAEVAETQPEWLAHHYTEAGCGGPAAGLWFKAALRAKAAYAHREAAAHLEKCLEVLSGLPDGSSQEPAAGARRLEALVQLGDVASLAGDLDGANRYYARALDLAPDAASRTEIANRQHRPHVAIRAGARIAFYEHGGRDRETLLFVSPLAYGLAAIQPVLERLCQEFRIVTVDARGSGASDPLTRPYTVDDHAQDVRAVIAALGNQPVVGIGISRGANLLFRLAWVEPALFEKLVTVGATPGTLSTATFRSEYVEQYWAAMAAQDIERLIRSHTELVYSEPEMRELREQTIRNRLRLPRETILSFFDPDPTVDVMPFLAEIAVPTLVTQGGEDRLHVLAAAERFAAQLPNARLHVFKGKGHLPIFTATDEFCNVLRSFVQTGAVGASQS
jgi:class 3 adenylate cyclase/pimeloyl-ACP methyl ester carboxylesterase